MSPLAEDAIFGPIQDEPRARAALIHTAGSDWPLGSGLRLQTLIGWKRHAVGEERRSSPSLWRFSCAPHPPPPSFLPYPRPWLPKNSVGKGVCEKNRGCVLPLGSANTWVGSRIRGSPIWPGRRPPQLFKTEVRLWVEEGTLAPSPWKLFRSVLGGGTSGSRWDSSVGNHLLPRVTETLLILQRLGPRKMRTLILRPPLSLLALRTPEASCLMQVLEVPASDFPPLSLCTRPGNAQENPGEEGQERWKRKRQPTNPDLFCVFPFTNHYIKNFYL
ncbi:uncharacterized protein LOC111719340 [Sarcophilus harrisii]|uniref:uncharacterized protein LOC111719340 n=1 Tax=Sarcophilus harrisii TaxID=9305 RepID=UPI001301E31D|nr:uncharacterized protein LOC111719340 [Sarcophilus harrisii]